MCAQSAALVPAPAPAPDSSAIENTVDYQRDHWRNCLLTEAAEARRTGDWSQLGKQWGDPNRADDPLGNYAFVRDLIKAHRVSAMLRGVEAEPTAGTSEFDILEIGSYGGKWTEHLIAQAGVAKRWGSCVWCSDLFQESEDVLSERFPEWFVDPSMSLTKFFLLDGDGYIPGCPFHLVFSMDSLVRAPGNILKNYLTDISEVLYPGGSAILHLPCSDIPGSRLRNFTDISLSRLHIICGTLFAHYKLHTDVLVHGVLLEAYK